MRCFPTTTTIVTGITICLTAEEASKLQIVLTRRESACEHQDEYNWRHSFAEKLRQSIDSNRESSL